MKKKVIIWIIIIVILGGIFYLYQNKDKQEPSNFLNEVKTFYRVSDFVGSHLETDEAQELVDRLNEAYVYLEEGSKPYLRWNDIAIYKKALSDYKGAEEAWRNAISLAENPGLAYGNLANLYFYHLRDFIKAEEYYKKALEISPHSFTYREGLADLYRYDMREKIDEVEQTMKEGADANKTNAIAYYSYLIEFFDGENNKSKVGEYTKKIKEIDPDWESIFQETIIE